MIRTKISAVVIAAAMTVFACKKSDTVSPENAPSSAKGGTTTTTVTTTATATGNGSLSGTHYQVNIIGVPKGKTADMTGDNGSRIFVALGGKTNIYLSEGPFAVLDANGTDGTAKFQLPNPDPTNSGTTTYSVFARPLGTPGGTSTTTTCATDPMTGLVVCSDASYVAVRNSGKTTFTNVSSQLLYIYADLNNDGVAERYPLFDDRLQNYFWQYDNNGLRVLQLRFYPVSTTVQ